MNIFYAHQGQFWLDNQPQLLQAAEFHYFRAAKTDWEHRLGLIKEAGFDAVATYIPWRWHQPDDITFDFTGYSHPLRDLAGFLELASKMDLWIIARPGPYIMAETTHEGIPDWLFSKYPQVQLIDQQQKVHQLASYNHPDFLSCVSNWYKEVFKVLAPQQITRGGKIIMVQLDNEMGMPHWVRNVFDTNMDTMNKFAQYIEHLRHNLQASADFLQHQLRHPQEPLGAIITAHYQRFYRKYLADYTTFLLNEAKASGMDVLPVVNIHGYANGAKTFPIGLSQLLTTINLPTIISATDVYPLSISEGNIHQILLANEMTKALQNPDQPLFSIEFQAGGNLDFGSGQSSLYDLHTRLCVSQGMRAFNHYLFFDGENHPDLSPVKRHDWGHPVRKDGSLRTHYHRYAKLSKVFKAYGQDLILSRPRTITSVGFVLDYFMTEVHNVTTQKKTNLLTQQRETILFDFIARGLTLTHRPFKALDLERGDLSNTPHCWVMIDKQCSGAVQHKLLNYALEGGNLILVGRLCLEDAEGQPCTILRDALGITVQASSAEQCQIFNHRDVPAFYLETYQGEVGQVFATQHSQTVGFIKNLGKGKVMLLGATLSAHTLDDLDIFNQMALEMNCAPLFDCSPWVDVRLSQSTKGDFLFVNNYLDDAVCTTINYQGQALFGGNSLYLPARSGQILPLEWQLRDTLSLHYITSEITEILEDASSLTIKTALQDFIAELTLSHHHCPEAVKLKTLDHGSRVMVKGTNHTLRLEFG